MNRLESLGQEILDLIQTEVQENALLSSEPVEVEGTLLGSVDAFDVKFATAKATQTTIDFLQEELYKAELILIQEVSDYLMEARRAVDPRGTCTFSMKDDRTVIFKFETGKHLTFTRYETGEYCCNDHGVFGASLSEFKTEGTATYQLFLEHINRGRGII